MSIRGLLILTFVFAILCLALQYAPVASLSTLLLAPFPIVLFSRGAIRRRFIKGRYAFALACILAASSFYVGFYCGPLTAFLTDRNGCGIPQTRMYLLKHWYKPIGKPIVFVLDHVPEWSAKPLQQYTRAWQAWGDEEERKVPDESAGGMPRRDPAESSDSPKSPVGRAS